MKIFNLGRKARKQISWHSLLSEVQQGATHASSPLHGDKHWRAVAAAGIEIAGNNFEQRAVALAFGMIHDCQRLNDDWDPEHGLRAASWASRSQQLAGLIGKEGRNLVSQACLDHENGFTSNDETIGLCWDADRINLWRVGVCPDQRFFSVLSGSAFEQMSVKYIDAWHRPPDWGELIGMMDAEHSLDGIESSP